MSAKSRAEETGMRPVTPPNATVSTLGFVGIIVLLIAIGLGGVMVVTTSVGAQSRDLTKLRREATHLRYTSAALESKLQRNSSANALAYKASELGMVPNPYPAFIHLSDGSITGVPTPVKGNELPFLRGDAVAPEPTPAPVVTPTPEPEPVAPDQVAAGLPGEGA